MSNRVSRNSVSRAAAFPGRREHGAKPSAGGLGRPPAGRSEVASRLPATVVRVFETPLGRIGVAATARGVVRVMLPNKVAGRSNISLLELVRGPYGPRRCAVVRGGCGDPPRNVCVEPPGRGCRPLRASAGAAKAEAHAERAEREIREYCAGRRRRFTVTIDLSGVPPFHRKVLAAARRIPCGRTVTYGELARRAGSPRAARAAGQAMAHNPVPLIVPCHRVVAAGGGLGGFGGGLALKRRLLALEGVERLGRR